MPRRVQQNLKRLKLRRTVRELSNGSKIHHDQFDIEIVDRVAVLRDVARWVGMFKDKPRKSSEGVAEAIRRAQERMKQAVRTFNNDTTEPVDPN